MKTIEKVLSMLLALCLCLSLCACGAPAQQEPAAQEPTVAEEPTAAEETAAQPEFEARELVFASTKAPTDDGGVIIQHFCDYITNATGGSITFNIFWSGTMCSLPEELDMVSSGSADMCALNNNPFAAQLPLLQFPNGTCQGYEFTVDYANQLLFGNETTSALIQGEAQANNIRYLGFSLNGSSGYYCNFEAYSLEDMAGHTFGTGKSGALQQSYGLNVVSMGQNDGYDSLSRGVVDCADLTAGAAKSMGWDEVTNYWVFYGLCAVGNYFSINLDTWNSLTDEEKAIFEAAGQDTLQFSIDMTQTLEDEVFATVQEEGITVTHVTGEAQETFAAASFRLDCENSLAKAETAGQVDNMKLVLQAASEIVGIDVTDILENY